MARAAILTLNGGVEHTLLISEESNSQKSKRKPHQNKEIFILVIFQKST